MVADDLKSGDNKIQSDGPIQKRRRKTYSCDSCRKMKTRCEVNMKDQDSTKGNSCHRCIVLRIPCSLENNLTLKFSKDEKLRDSRIDNNIDGTDKLTILERKLDYLIDKLGKDDPKLRRINGDWEVLKKYGSVKSNHLDNSIKNSPNFIISKIDLQLFKRVDSYKLFENLNNELFIKKFFTNNKRLILKLGSEFLKVAHFWIIPGGINEITTDYVLKHPFITSVFVLISMSFDENYQYVNEQSELNLIVRKTLSSALITSNLTDHDIEAILYCCIFNVSRKPLQPLLDTWSLSGDGVKKMITGINFLNIKRRVSQDEFNEDDLFHLRIWVALVINHLYNSIGNGRPHLIPEDYFNNDVGDLVLKFPNMIIGDQINYHLSKLMKIIYMMFHSSDLFEDVIKYNELGNINGLVVFKFNDLTNWFNSCSMVIDLDQSNTLLFNVDYYYITLSKRFVSFYRKIEHDRDVIVKYLNIGYSTAIHYSTTILERFLELPSNLIRGSPISLLNQVTYSCLTLYEYHDKVNNLTESIDPLNLISRVYWKLNKIGETKNDFTDTVGQIIKSLVDVNHTEETTEQPKSDEEFFIPLHDEINNFGFTENFTDISKFDTFEDFFNDINK